MAILGFVANRPRFPLRFPGILIFLATLMLSRSARGAEHLVSKEYQVKAVFLLNFAEFVDWPPEAFSGPGAPFIVAVLGDDPFGKVLDQVVTGETVHGRPIEIRRFRDGFNVPPCHILFISQSEESRLTRILPALEGRPILSVGDIETFAKSNGIIQFILVQNHVRLKINVSAARAASLSISSQLLRQAEIVEAQSP